MDALSNQQELAVRAVDEWLLEFKQGRAPQTFELFGSAGTGKTTIAKYIAANVEGNVIFAAYTGKAAHVLRRKGCTNATTIHKLMYRPAGETPESPELQQARNQLADIEAMIDAKGITPQLTSDQASALARVTFLEKREPRKRPVFSMAEETDARYAKLIIIDECSMVDQRMGADLESLGVPILVLGDPAQLPPVGGGGYFTNREPRIMLTEVHRQAKESGILQIATLVREGRSLSPGQYGNDCIVVRKGDSRCEQFAMEADQILVGRNSTRHASNAKMRTLLKIGNGSPYPVGGDRLICLRNNHNIGLLNGSLWRVHEAGNDPEMMTGTLRISSIEDPDAPPLDIVSWLHHFARRETDLQGMGWAKRDYEEFDMSYAITVHKSQGSQFDDVYLFDESSTFGKDAPRHLYTGITRAAKSLTVVI